MIRTRFAPSPTGTLHLGNIRTALFAWAYARHHKGQFILRIEDTDLERSSDSSAEGILRDMKWLGLDIDEGPFFQMQRMDRYREVVAQMLADGRAYHCYMSVEELDALRETQKAKNEKPRYDGRWRPENIPKLGLKIPAGVDPVIRFRNADDGVVAWDDAVKGHIEIANSELDDLVIARPAPVGQVGVPTYNFCVVVDDIDMKISHVIRGDGHVMNTPRQINIFRALGVEPPVFGHLPTVLGNDGEKLSKRHGATGLDWYQQQGYLPEAIINGLSRLGWSHGNDEIFTPQQLVEWFNLESLTPSPARFDAEKFEWLNGEHIKRLPLDELARRLEPFLKEEGYVLAVHGSTSSPRTEVSVSAAASPVLDTGSPRTEVSVSAAASPVLDTGSPRTEVSVLLRQAQDERTAFDPALDAASPQTVVNVSATLSPARGEPVEPRAIAELLRERAPTLKKMAEMACYCFVAPSVDATLLGQHVNDANKPAIQWVKEQLASIEWSKPAIAAMLKEAQTKFNVKTPQVMMPLRVMLTGSAQAPSVDALLLTLGRQTSLARIAV